MPVAGGIGLWSLSFILTKDILWPVFSPKHFLILFYFVLFIVWRNKKYVYFVCSSYSELLAAKRILWILQIVGLEFKNILLNSGYKIHITCELEILDLDYANVSNSWRKGNLGEKRHTALIEVDNGLIIRFMWHVNIKGNTKSSFWEVKQGSSLYVWDMETLPKELKDLEVIWSRKY